MTNNTQATALRVNSLEVGFWQLAGSLAILVVTFYFIRKLAAKIFRVSILISGKEPSFIEVIKLAQHTTSRL